MTKYKTFFIPTRQEFKGKMDKATSWRTDGLALTNEIQALLSEYSSLGYKFVSQQAITGSNGSMHYMSGMIIILEKEK